MLEGLQFLTQPPPFARHSPPQAANTRCETMPLPAGKKVASCTRSRAERSRNPLRGDGLSYLDLASNAVFESSLRPPSRLRLFRRLRKQPNSRRKAEAVGQNIPTLLEIEFGGRGAGGGRGPGIQLRGSPSLQMMRKRATRANIEKDARDCPAPAMQGAAGSVGMGAGRNVARRRWFTLERPSKLSTCQAES